MASIAPTPATTPTLHRIARKRERIDRLRTLRSRIDLEIAELQVEIMRDRYVPDGRKKRSRHVVPACGTETAYQRHRWLGEDADPACKAGHAAYVKAGALRRLSAQRESGAA